MIWVVVANTSSCRIYHFNRKENTLTALKEMVHPEARLKGSDLTSDKQGKYLANDAGHGAYSPHVNAKEIEIENFARDIGHELATGRTQNAYDNLVLFAAPHMNGIIQNQLDHHVKALITRDIKKDYCHLADNELIEVVQEAMKPH